MMTAKIKIEEKSVQIILSKLLPRREHYNDNKGTITHKRDYSIEKSELYLAFEEAIPARYDWITAEPVILIYIFHYPVKYRAFDNDAIDTKYCTDLISSYFLFGDGPSKVSFFIDASFEDIEEPFTEIIVVKREDALEFIQKICLN